MTWKVGLAAWKALSSSNAVWSCHCVLALAHLINDELWAQLAAKVSIMKRPVTSTMLLMPLFHWQRWKIAIFLIRLKSFVIHLLAFPNVPFLSSLSYFMTFTPPWNQILRRLMSPTLSSRFSLAKVY